jgi:GWxTD domain-containing protein
VGVKVHTPVSAVLAAFIIVFPSSNSETELSNSDQQWLEQEVASLITKEEVLIFKGLGSDDDRERFKELFWMRRDPDLVTLENELREEFERRVRTADHNFGRRGRRGATTDMGKVFLLLGRPARTDQTHQEGAGRIESSTPDPLVPALPGSDGVRTVSWYYERDPERGIPDGFVVQLQSQSGWDSRLRPSEEVEEVLEQVRNSYVVNQGIDYSRDESGRLMEPPSRFDPNSPAKNVLRKMMEGNLESTDISFDLDVGLFRAADGSYVPMLFQIDPASLSWDDEIAAVTVFGLIESVEGRPVAYFEEPVKLTRPANGPSTFEMPLSLPVGHYTFNLGVLDDISHSAGTRRIPLFVPDFDSRGLVLSSVLLYKEKRFTAEGEGTPGQAFRFGDTHFEPVGRRPLAPDDNLGVFFFVYGYGLNSDGQPHLTAETIFFMDGEPRERIQGLPLHADASQAYADLEVPLADFEPGRYRIEIQVTDHVTHAVIGDRVDFVLRYSTPPDR